MKTKRWSDLLPAALVALTLLFAGTVRAQDYWGYATGDGPDTTVVAPLVADSITEYAEADTVYDDDAIAYNTSGFYGTVRPNWFWRARPRVVVSLSYGWGWDPWPYPWGYYEPYYYSYYWGPSWSFGLPYWYHPHYCGWDYYGYRGNWCGTSYGYGGWRRSSYPVLVSRGSRGTRLAGSTRGVAGTAGIRGVSSSDVSHVAVGRQAPGASAALGVRVPTASPQTVAPRIPVRSNEATREMTTARNARMEGSPVNAAGDRVAHGPERRELGVRPRYAQRGVLSSEQHSAPTQARSNGIRERREGFSERQAQPRSSGSAAGHSGGWQSGGGSRQSSGGSSGGFSGGSRSSGSGRSGRAR